MVIFNSKLLVYQRVNKSSWRSSSIGFPAVIAVTSATGTSFAQSSCSANSGQEISSMVFAIRKIAVGV